MIPFYIGLVVCSYVLWKAYRNFGNSYGQHGDHLAGVIRSIEELVARHYGHEKPVPPTAQSIQAQANAFLQDVEPTPDSAGHLETQNTTTHAPTITVVTAAPTDVQSPEPHPQKPTHTTDLSIDSQPSHVLASDSSPSHSALEDAAAPIVSIAANTSHGDKDFTPVEIGNTDRAMIEELQPGSRGFMPVAAMSDAVETPQGAALLENLLADADRAEMVARRSSPDQLSGPLLLFRAEDGVRAEVA